MTATTAPDDGAAGPPSAPGVLARRRSGRLLAAAVRRIGQAVVTVFVASTLTFLLQPLAPGDVVLDKLSAGGRPPTPDAIAAERHRLGLDRPLPVQYADWLGGVLQGDLGRSAQSQGQVAELVGQRLGPTVLLGGLALAAGLMLALVLAGVSVLGLGRWPDHAVRAGVLVAVSLPSFVVGLLALQYVVVGLGIGTVLTDGTLRTVALPAAVLALGIGSWWARPLRALISEQLGSPYVQAARARGSSRLRLLLVHAVPNAFVPFLGVLGLGVGAVLGGAVVVETVFAWPGLGQLAVTAVRVGDVPVVQATVLLATVGYVSASLLADLAAIALDPRLRRPQPAGGGAG